MDWGSHCFVKLDEGARSEKKIGRKRATTYYDVYIIKIIIKTHIKKIMFIINSEFVLNVRVIDVK